VQRPFCLGNEIKLDGAFAGATDNERIEAMSDDPSATGWLPRIPWHDAATGLLGRIGRLGRPLREMVRMFRQARTVQEPLLAPEPTVEAGAEFLERIHVEPAGRRRYRLYLPASLGDAPARGLVLMLHGCKQTPEDFALGTDMNRLAERDRLIVAYPAQARGEHPSRCWNWFRPADQLRGFGEPAILAGLARALVAEFDVPEGRVFVAGLSAGGAMAAVLGMAYPDVFAVVGVHSGVSHGSANDAVSALAAMRGEGAPDPLGIQVPLIVFHGDADTVVHPANAERLAAAGRGAGAPRVRRGKARGRRFSCWVDDGGEVPALELWMVRGAGHAWSGGNPEGSFADPAGPDASAEMVRFFLEHAR
jgi:poly(hydroxyalkanoate) depolymerase family esterase